MVTAQIETITIATGKFYCDHSDDCIKSIILPPDVAEIMMNDNTLFLIIDGCLPSRSAHKRDGTVVKQGKGWKVYRLV